MGFCLWGWGRWGCGWGARGCGDFEGLRAWVNGWNGGGGFVFRGRGEGGRSWWRRQGGGEGWGGGVELGVDGGWDGLGCLFGSFGWGRGGRGWVFALCVAGWLDSRWCGGRFLFSGFLGPRGFRGCFAWEDGCLVRVDGGTLVDFVVRVCCRCPCLFLELPLFLSFRLLGEFPLLEGLH